jgi:hypothetical protein
MVSIEDNPWNFHPGPDALGESYDAFLQWFLTCRGAAAKALPRNGNPYLESDSLAWAYHPIIKNMNPDKARELAVNTWQAMWDARQWSAQQDEYQRWRGRVKGAREYQRELAEAGEVLKQAGSYPSLGLSLAKFIFYLQKHGVKLAPSNPEEKRNIGELLAVLGEGLAESAEIAPERAWDCYGCLEFRRELDQQGNKPEAAAMLSFHLVLLNRLATMDNPPRLMMGTPMPSDGKPLYQAVAAAVSVALNQEWTAKAAKDAALMLTKADCRFIGWQAPDFISQKGED